MRVSFFSGCLHVGLLVGVTGYPHASARGRDQNQPEANAPSAKGAEESDQSEGAPPITSQGSRTAPPLTPSFLGAGRAAPLVYAGVEGGWEGARRTGVFESNIEAGILGPLSIRAGAATMSASDGKAHPVLALKADLLRQEAHGIDGAVFGGYRGQGFNLVPAIEIGAALGRRTGRVSWGASIAYGQGTQRAERYGDARAAALTRVTRGLDLRVGLDARARFDLEYDSDEPAGEAGFDGTAGPLLVWGVGHFMISGQAGVGALSMRSGGATAVGMVSRLGVGAFF